MHHEIEFADGTSYEDRLNHHSITRTGVNYTCKVWLHTWQGLYPEHRQEGLCELHMME